jgi:AcrR family transcriptional regulator
MAKKSGPNRENLEATRRVFLTIARKEFSTKGYYGASTGDIVEESGMARGSLYYHFGDKKGLFKAVYEEAMIEMQDVVTNNIKDIKDPWERFIKACLTVLDLCTQNDIRRIVVDVHTALTYRERFEILTRTLVGEFTNILSMTIESGYFRGHNPRLLMMMIFGIISESGRSFEISNDIPKSRQELGDTLVKFLETARA